MAPYLYAYALFILAALLLLSFAVFVHDGVKYRRDRWLCLTVGACAAAGAVVAAGGAFSLLSLAAAVSP